MRISKYFSRSISLWILLLLSTLCVSAQQRKQMVMQDTDSIATFRGIAVSTDLVGPIQLLVSSYGQIEGAIRLNFKDRYYPIVELGYGTPNSDGCLPAPEVRTRPFPAPKPYPQ